MVFHNHHGETRPDGKMGNYNRRNEIKITSNQLKVIKKRASKKQRQRDE